MMIKLLKMTMCHRIIVGPSLPVDASCVQTTIEEPLGLLSLSTSHLLITTITTYRPLCRLSCNLHTPGSYTSLCQLHWSVGYDQYKLTQSHHIYWYREASQVWVRLVKLPYISICDDRITENDWCIIHCIHPK